MGKVELPALLYLHGGAYVGDLLPSHWRFAARLACQANAVVHVPRYPLAPENGWRTSRAALLALASGVGIGATPILVGDSAGGGLALALAQARAAEMSTSAPVVLVSPWVDLTLGQDPELMSATRDPWLDGPSLRQSGRLWAAGDDPASPEISPLHGSFDDLPPVLVLSGTRDILHPQAIALSGAIESAGGIVEAVTAPGLMHVYPLLPIPEARPAAERIATFISSRAARQTG